MGIGIGEERGRGERGEGRGRREREEGEGGGRREREEGEEGEGGGKVYMCTVIIKVNDESQCSSFKHK